MANGEFTTDLRNLLDFLNLSPPQYKADFSAKN